MLHWTALFCDMTQETMDNIETKKNATMEELDLTNPNRKTVLFVPSKPLESLKSLTADCKMP